MEPSEMMIALASDSALDLSGDFAQWAPGNNPRKAALDWLDANRFEYFFRDDLIYVSPETLEAFNAAWAR